MRVAIYVSGIIYKIKCLSLKIVLLFFQNFLSDNRCILHMFKLTFPVLFAFRLKYFPIMHFECLNYFFLRRKPLITYFILHGREQKEVIGCIIRTVWCIIYQLCGLTNQIFSGLGLKA